MENLKIDIDNKFIKRLNIMNQDAKYLYEIYFIFPNGVISSHSKHYKLQKGIHYGITDFKVLDSITEIIKFNSSAIFKTIKDNKKDLKHLIIRDNVIILSGEKEYPIGNIVKIDSMSITDLISFTKLNKVFIDNFINQIDLSEDEVIELVKNDFKDIICSDHTTRITKELIPGLKKTHIIDMKVIDSENIELYNIYIRSQRDSMTTIHQYKCVRLNYKT